MTHPSIQHVKSVKRLERRIKMIGRLPRVAPYDAAVEFGTRLVLTLHEANTTINARTMREPTSDAAQIAEAMIAEIIRDPDAPAAPAAPQRHVRALPCVANYMLMACPLKVIQGLREVRPV